MNNLPPIQLTRAWLSIIQDERISSDIIQNRIRLLVKYYGSIELAILYLEQENLE